MGDTLDSHEVSRNGPFKLAEQLFERASVITKVIILIGNHDLINQHQFLTDAHFFGPYKRWPNITIVDKPSLIVVGKMNFAFCPYVDKGRLVERLETLKNDQTNSYDWVNATAIFGHSEVLGAIISPGKSSTKGMSGVQPIRSLSAATFMRNNRSARMSFIRVVRDKLTRQRVRTRGCGWLPLLMG